MGAAHPGPTGRRGVAPSTPLRLARIEHATFPGTVTPWPKEDRRYVTDLVRSFDRPDPPPHSFAGGRTTFRDMVDELSRRLGPAASFDLAVLAHCTPDAEPGWPAYRLLDLTDSAGTAFAVSDQGPTVAFTGLRLATGAGAGPGPRRAHVWALDQRRTLHGEAVPARVRATTDAAAVLVLEPDGPLEIATAGHLAGVRREDVGDVLRAAADAADTGGPPVTAVWGIGVPPEARGTAAVASECCAEAGRPVTGVWSALSALWTPARPGSGPYLVSDYDEDLGYLGYCVLRPVRSAASASDGP